MKKNPTTRKGEVWDPINNILLAVLNKDQSYRGWKYKRSGDFRWIYEGNSAYNGTYYLEGNVKISGNPGTPEAPWTATIIVTLDLQVSGNPKLVPHLSGTALVSGDDIKINGNPEVLAPGGLIAVREEIEITGNPTINGYILAENGPSISQGTFSISDNEISGNPTITYNCGLNPPLQGPLQTLAWGP
jgi:hypothetical protein